MRFIEGCFLACAASVVSLLILKSDLQAQSRAKFRTVKCAPWIADLNSGTVKKAKKNYQCFAKLAHALNKGYRLDGAPGTNPPVVPPAESELKFSVSGAGSDFSKGFKFVRFPVQVTWKVQCPFSSQHVLLKLYDPKSGSSAEINVSSLFSGPSDEGTKLSKEEFRGELRIKAEADDPLCTWRLDFEQGV